MPWINKQSSPSQVANELKTNLEDKEDNARLLILGTQTEEGYIMRMTLKHPEAVAGIIYNHAVKTGEIKEALAMIEAMARIAGTAEKLIRQEVEKRRLNN
jgi:hypothetical protein